MQALRFPTRCLSATALALLSACAGGSGDASPLGQAVLRVQPGNSTNAPMPLPLGRWGVGALASNPEYWSITLAAGDVIRIDVHGLRADEGGQVPLLTLFAPSGTESARHRNALWQEPWTRDLDVPMHVVRETGDYKLILHPFVTQPMGRDYAVRVTTVAVPNLVEEQEPRAQAGGNDLWATGEPLAPDSIVHGYLEAGGEDFFRFDLVTRSVVRAPITMAQIGLDRQSSVYARPRLVLWRNGTPTHSFTGSHADVSPAFALEPGQYALEVHESSGNNDVRGEYFLELDARPLPAVGEVEPNGSTALAMPIGTDFLFGSVGPTDTDFYSFHAEAGDVVELESARRLDAQGALHVVVVAPDGVQTVGGSQGHYSSALIQETGTHYLSVTGTDDYWVRLVGRTPSALEVEPNDAPAAANPLSLRLSGHVDAADDSDVFSFPAAQDVLVVLDLYSTQHDFTRHHGIGSLYTPRIVLRDPAGVTVKVVDGPSGPRARGLAAAAPTDTVSFVPSMDGTYTIELDPMDPSHVGASYKYVVVRR